MLPVSSISRSTQIGLGIHGPRLHKTGRSLVTPRASEPSGENKPIPASVALDSSSLPRNFCIIEDRGTVQDFGQLQVQEITQGIEIRRNRVFLLMEEIRRLRIQERVKGGDDAGTDERNDEFDSAVPWIPKVTENNLDQYYMYYFLVVIALIIFGGLVAPILEVKLGLGGASYQEFIQSLHLPGQLALVDPIVASFCGGAVGAISTLLVVEVKNIQAQQAERCLYCGGSGYLECGSCAGSGCSDCSYVGKVMCTSCLCTGKSMATEHDVRADPFD